MHDNEKITVAVDADTAGFDTAMKQVTQSTLNFGKIFTSSIKQAATTGKSFEDTLRSIGKRISNMALNSAFKPLENLISSGLNSAITSALTPPTFAKGDAFGSSGIVPFAKGGVVSSPSYFQYAGGTGIMGEAGAEAILPLARGADGKLGVSAGGGNQKPVNVVFNINANDANSFRKSESQITTMLTRAVARGQRNL